MITAAQMRAARALLGIDQRQLADLSGVSLQTIQRMEASEGNVRGIVDSLTRVVEAFHAAGIELIGENVRSLGDGRGVRFRHAAPMTEAIFGQKLLQRRSQYSVSNGPGAETPRKTGSLANRGGKHHGHGKGTADLGEHGEVVDN